MTDPPNPSPPKHTGGKFKKGVSGNPGGKKRVIPASQEAPLGLRLLRQLLRRGSNLDTRGS
jgi:hypothetical protein